MNMLASDFFAREKCISAREDGGHGHQARCTCARGAVCVIVGDGIGASM